MVSYKDIMKYLSFHCDYQECNNIPYAEVYPIDKLTDTEQFLVDIIGAQEITISEIKEEYTRLTDKKPVSSSLISRYLSGLENKGLVSSYWEGRNKLFKLTEYGGKFLLPI